MKKKIKILTAMFAFSGLFSVSGAAAMTGDADATDGKKPCNWCCPPDLCGLNGPDFDGTIPIETDTVEPANKR